jgi:DNA-binding NarL/FixJ family response regulator
MKRPEYERPTSVVVVEDQKKLRDMLELIIDGTQGMTCVGAFDSAETLFASALGTIDVVLLDLGLPGMHGTQAIQPIVERWKGADVLVLTVHEEDEHVFEAMCAGAVGYLLKPTQPAELIAAIQQVREGGAPMTPSIARRVLGFIQRRRFHDDALTEREMEVLDHIIDCKTNRQIADELFISSNTVAFHIKQIYSKLHVHSRSEAVRRVLRGRRRHN